MDYLIDTNICTYILNKQPKAVMDRFEQFDTGQIAVSTVTVAELNFGARKSSRMQQNIERLELFLFPFEILVFDSIAASHYGEIRQDLERRGCVIGQLDMLIAAQALANKLTLVTNNQKEFSRVQNLKLDNWN